MPFKWLSDVQYTMCPIHPQNNVEAVGCLEAIVPFSFFLERSLKIMTESTVPHSELFVFIGLIQFYNAI